MLLKPSRSGWYNYSLHVDIWMDGAVGNGLNKIPGKPFFGTVSYYAALSGLDLMLLLPLLPQVLGLQAHATVQS